MWLHLHCVPFTHSGAAAAAMRSLVDPAGCASSMDPPSDCSRPPSSATILKPSPRDLCIRSYKLRNTGTHHWPWLTESFMWVASPFRSHACRWNVICTECESCSTQPIINHITFLTKRNDSGCEIHVHLSAYTFWGSGSVALDLVKYSKNAS